MEEVCFSVVSFGGRWRVMRGPTVRCVYTSKRQAVSDGRQLAMMENELHRRAALFRVVGSDGQVEEETRYAPRVAHDFVEDFVNSMFDRRRAVRI